MKKRLVLTLFMASAMLATLSAQKVDVEKLEGLKIRNIGPAGMSGRVTSIDVDLSDADVIYAGTASGGVWKSTSGGIDWEPIFDDQPVQSIGALTINQKNTDEIWVGTGEGNPRNSQNSGEGIYRSLDGGDTWTCMGLKGTKTIHRIIIHRDNPNVVYVAAHGSAWGPNEERGVYRTTDSGKNWEKILYINDETGCADLVVDPTNPNKLIAAMWEYGRKPWFFNSGGKGSGMYVTYDGGETWTKRTSKDGLPEGNLGRMGLAIAPSNPDIVYALVEAKENALFKSTDGGKKWRKITEANGNVGNRPFYYFDIFVDPQNENRIYSLHSSLTYSEDGGRTFTPRASGYANNGIHPDHHAFWVHPEDPSYLIEGNDGGLNISRDGGKTWRFIQNLPLAQFYHIDYDMDIPYNVMGGLQDNGSWIGPSAVWQSGGIRNHHWQEIFFGDGFDVAVRPDNNRYAYAMSQGGNLGYIDRETGKSDFIKPVHPGDVKLRFHWNAAFAQNPFHGCGIYYGSQFVHKSMDCGQSWEIISPDLTTNDTTKQRQFETGGLTIDNTQAENHTTILAIAPSPVDEKVIWVGTDDGNLQITKDGGKSWSNVVSSLPGVKAGSWIPQIEVSKKNAGEAFIIVNDYRRNDWRPMAFHTNDFGASFRQIANEKQVHGHALSIVQDPEVAELLWLGTDFGLYFTIDGGENWNKWDNDYPSVSTADLKIHPREHDLIIGTFGRAVWILDDIRPIRELARSKGKILEQAFKVFEAPDAYLAERRSYDGMHFPGDAVFMGDNRNSGAMVTLWMKKQRKPKVGKSGQRGTGARGGPAGAGGQAGRGRGGRMGRAGGRGEEVKVTVYNMAGDSIRGFSSPVDTGMNRVYWNLRKDGPSFPSRRSASGGGGFRGGGSGGPVLPGEYKLLFTMGKQKDSTMVTVHADPRLKVSMDDLKARDVAYDAFAGIVTKASDSFKQLLDARKTISLVNNALVNAPDSTKKAISEQGKELTKKLDELEKLYMTPDGLKGIQRSSDNLNGDLGGVSRYLRSLNGPANQPVKIMMKKAESRLAKVLGQVNGFFEEDFAEYKKEVQAVKYSLFKDIEPVKMK